MLEVIFEEKRGSRITDTCISVLYTGTCNVVKKALFYIEEALSHDWLGGKVPR